MNLFVLKPKQFHFHKVLDTQYLPYNRGYQLLLEVDTLDRLVLLYNNDIDRVSLELLYRIMVTFPHPNLQEPPFVEHTQVYTP